MRACFYFIINHNAIEHGGGKDVRYEVFKDIVRLLDFEGHEIGIKGVNQNVKIPSDMKRRFYEYKNISELRSNDLYVTWYPHSLTSKFIRDMRNQLMVNVIVYEHGHLKDSVIIDPKGLLGQSAYVDTLNDLCEENYDAERCDKFRKMYLGKDLSKRPQKIKPTKVPEEYLGKYIFVPTQKHTDISLVDAELGVMEMLQRVIAWAEPNQIPVVIKIHPHISNELLDQQVTVIKKAKEEHPGTPIVISTGSINTLIRESLFVVNLNGTTIMDCFVNQKPTLVLLPSMYYKTDAVVYSRNVENGLEKMNRQDYDLEKMLDKQRKIIWWYLTHSLHYKNTPRQNLDILKKHLLPEVRDKIG